MSECFTCSTTTSSKDPRKRETQKTSLQESKQIPTESTAKDVNNLLQRSRLTASQLIINNLLQKVKTYCITTPQSSRFLDGRSRISSRSFRINGLSRGSGNSNVTLLLRVEDIIIMINSIVIIAGKPIQ